MDGRITLHMHSAIAVMSACLSFCFYMYWVEIVHVPVLAVWRQEHELDRADKYTTVFKLPELLPNKEKFITI